MPTYEYTCKKCGQRIEAVQSFSEKPLRKHAECGGELQKVFHARGVVFKGSGFYSTDSRSPATASQSSSKSDTATKGDKPPSSTSSPAAKTSPSKSTSTASD